MKVSDWPVVLRQVATADRMTPAHRAKLLEIAEAMESALRDAKTAVDVVKFLFKKKL